MSLNNDMENTPSFYMSLTDIEIKNRLDKAEKEELLNIADNLPDKRLAGIIPLCKKPEEILYLLEERISDIFDWMDIFYLKNITHNNRLYDYVPSYKKKGLEDVKSLENNRIGYYISDKYQTFSVTDSKEYILNNLSGISNYIILTEKNKFAGIVKLSDLLISESTEEILKKKYPVLYKYDYTSDFMVLDERCHLPLYVVLNKDKTIYGIISARSVNEIKTMEIKDDYYKMAGLTEIAYDHHTGKMMGRRIPWLITSVMTLLALGIAMYAFMEQITAYPVLPVFMAFVLMISTCYAVMVNQSTIVFLRKKRTYPKKEFRYIRREIKKGFNVALLLGIITFTLFYIVIVIRKDTYLQDIYYSTDAFRMAGLMGVAVFTSVLIGMDVGIAAPYVIAHFNYDYSISSMPLITSVCDGINMFIFFLLAELILNVL